MAKVKLLRRVWRKEAGTIFEVSDEQEAFLLRKRYGEPVPEPIKPKVADVKRKTKVDPELKKRSKK